MTKVSIITISFNAEQHLQQTIDSVTNQTHKAIEYIIVDGGSSDGTIEIIKKNANHITKWVSEKDNGISDAFNKGIRMCTGEIIGLVNADDWLEPNAVETAVNEIGQADLLYGDIQFWNNERPVNRTNSDHRKLRLGMSVAHPACFVKKSVYEKFGSFDMWYKVAMDYDLLLRFYQHNVRFKKVNAILSNMRLAGNSDKRWLKGLHEELEIKDRYFNMFINRAHFVRQCFIFTAKAILRKFNHYT